MTKTSRFQPLSKYTRRLSKGTVGIFRKRGITLEQVDAFVLELLESLEPLADRHGFSLDAVYDVYSAVYFGAHWHEEQDAAFHYLLRLCDRHGIPFEDMDALFQDCWEVMVLREPPG